jgi:hypothetical protein
MGHFGNGMVGSGIRHWVAGSGGKTPPFLLIVRFCPRDEGSPLFGQEARIATVIVVGRGKNCMLAD